jgi:hypothetical protein
MKQLHLATQQMALDRQATGDKDLPAWTCSGTIPLTFTQWTNALVTNGYLMAADVQKLLSHREKRKYWFDRMHTNVMTVFAVPENDPPGTLFLATRNWQGLQSPTLANGVYPKEGFVIFHKGGSGILLRTNQTSATNLIG